MQAEDNGAEEEVDEGWAKLASSLPLAVNAIFDFTASIMGTLMSAAGLEEANVYEVGFLYCVYVVGKGLGRGDSWKAPAVTRDLFCAACALWEDPSCRKGLIERGGVLKMPECMKGQVKEGLKIKEHLRPLFDALMAERAADQAGKLMREERHRGGAEAGQM